MGYPRKQSPEAWAQQLNFAALERAHGLPAGVLTNLVRQESQGDTMALSHSKARGLCQFMPKTARAMGVDVNDPVSSINGAAKYLEDLMDMFGGDARKAVAAYNCGQGNLGKVIKRYDDDWENHLGEFGLNETIGYVKAVADGVQPRSGKHVGSAIGESYVQRVRDHTVTEEDDRLETERRLRQAKEENVDTAKLDTMGGILAMAFFSLIAGALTTKYDKLGPVTGHQQELNDQAPASPPRSAATSVPISAAVAGQVKKVEVPLILRTTLASANPAHSVTALHTSGAKLPAIGLAHA